MTTITPPGPASTRAGLALRSHRSAPVAVPPAPAYDHAFPEDFASVFQGSSTQRSTIGCVIPAYNEEESIASVIEGLSRPNGSESGSTRTVQSHSPQKGRAGGSDPKITPGARSLR